ncbi:hypothetical protein ASPACDRAFT_43854 [Aspergillus aculeatus ATCC 16872]|uniref:Tat pathway signal sequence n=1 Tax=Aspergillus aculeatus (strain ATCC 16872 / CBS 172.66 / WB 5094) TaxID=690307 RepID=A0A1L9WSE1_ASPA1|nr:uncharacterized protein ASPACDRAFT_43854 [Aspergillus aculeatus ATCC 16872]OJJ99189.1 hypothetical protein ASPACDRAFT_43854 [Aspergillus aculeatus ATCC 16872]
MSDSRDFEPSTDDGQESASNDRRVLMRHQTLRGWKKHILSPVVITLIVLCLLVCGLIVAVLVKLHPTDGQCSRQLSSWSPALDAVEYIDYDFDGAFNATSIYRGPPTHERESAWFNLTYKHAVEIPPEKLSALNKSEADHLQHVPPEVGPGYIGLLENIVRMYTWWQAGKYDEPPEGLVRNELKNRIHVDHCIESLRVALMCQSDVSLLYVQIGGAAGIRADFASHHRCRDFRRIEEWIDENWTVV